MLVDSHCHLDFPDFADDLDAIVARAEAAGVGRIVTISTRVKRFDALLAITTRFPNVYCSVGTHPHQADEEDGIPAEELIALTKHPKVVALGEAGLDYFYQHGSRDAQERGFRAHIAAARATNSGMSLPLPMICSTNFLRTLFSAGATFQSLSSISAWVGCATNLPLMRAMRVAPSGPSHGISLTISDAEAPMMLSMSGSFSPSALSRMV